jgi:hypothetical protein
MPRRRFFRSKDGIPVADILPQGRNQPGDVLQLEEVRTACCRCSRPACPGRRDFSDRSKYRFQVLGKPARSTHPIPHTSHRQACVCGQTSELSADHKRGTSARCWAWWLRWTASPPLLAGMLRNSASEPHVVRGYGYVCEK